MSKLRLEVLLEKNELKQHWLLSLFNLTSLGFNWLLESLQNTLVFESIAK
jgi:hypothetical protein